jgi:hypothetical protein
MPEHAPDHQAREFAAAFREFLDWIHSSGTEEGNEVFPASVNRSLAA